MSRLLITFATISLLCHLASSQASNQDPNKDIVSLLCHLASSKPVSSNLISVYTKICGTCPAGTYKGNSASLKCQQCPAGKFGAGGVTSCTDCPAGKFSEAGQAECKLCPGGHFGESTGMSRCQPCPIGTFNSQEGGLKPSACIKCPAGSYGFSNGSSECPKCPAGTFSASPGSLECSKCTWELQYSDEGATSCRDCPNKGFSQDGICLKMENFKSCNSSISILEACRLLIDGNRTDSKSVYGPTRDILIKKYEHRHWMGFLKSSMFVKKVVLIPSELTRNENIRNIKVYALRGTELTPTLCGTVSSDLSFNYGSKRKYAMINCNQEANAIKLVKDDKDGIILAEVEVYV